MHARVNSLAFASTNKLKNVIMGVIIAKHEDIKKYFSSDRRSQSSLKDLEGGLGSFLSAIAKREKDKEENKPTPDYFLIGGAVDTILTGEEKEFDNQYYISRMEKKPSDAIVGIIEEVYNELESAGDHVLSQTRLEDCYNLISIAALSIAYQPNWKEATRVKKIIEAGEDYFTELSEAGNKEIITAGMKDRIDNIVNSLRNNERTKKYFDRDLQSKLTDIDFYYQLPIYFEYLGVDSKALLDLVVVQRDGKGEIVSVEPIDLKTMSGQTLHFISSLRKRRYDIQAAWYSLALESYFKTDKIKLFKFIVESTTSVGHPVVFECTKETMEHGKNGFPGGEFFSEDKARSIYYPKTKGYHDYITEYKHYEENEFREDIILDTNTGPITLDYKKGIL
jgi:hypothetical protein